MAIYDLGKVRDTLQDRCMTAHHRLAQKAELSKLAGLIQTERPSNVLDIGVGNGRVPYELSKLPLWNHISSYVGIDLSQSCLADAKTQILKARSNEKVALMHLDARKLSSLQKDFDLIFTTYFTAGNFRPDEFDLVFGSAYNLLNAGGTFVLGSIYKNNDRVRLIQEELYQNCGMQVIHNGETQHVETKEGFWSRRFTNSQILDSFPRVDSEMIQFIPLDAEDFAQMVIIKKEG